MALDAELRGLFRQTINVATLVSATHAGDGIFGTPFAVPARVEPHNSIVDTRPTGEEITSDWRIFTMQPIGIKDRIWLPGFDSNDPTMGRFPKRVDPFTDEDGSVSHYEVML